MKRNEEKENADPKELFIPETLGDLYKLIQLGYPQDQCAEWLALIRQANSLSTGSAWLLLKKLMGTAALPFTVTEEQWFVEQKLQRSKPRDKFSALNVITNTPKITPSKGKTLDPKQVSTSSAIKFALQQRAVKRLSSDLGGEAVSLNYFATPGRRSTRKSTCQYKSTSTSQLFSKFEDIAPGDLQEMMFQKNAALEPRE